MRYIAIMWLVCGILNYGFYVAYFQRTWPMLARQDAVRDRVIASLISLIGGPISIAAGFIIFKRYGKGWMI